MSALGPLKRRLLRTVRSLRRSTKRRLQDELAPATLAADLRAAGFALGDVVMVHGALSPIGRVQGGADGVIASIEDVVGSEGTIVMPTYVDAAAVLEASSRGEPADLRTQAAGTGRITEVFRTRPGVLRSSHPFSSACAWGAQAAYVTSGHALQPGIAHADSPIGRVLELGGKVLGIGISLGPMSFYHVIEEGPEPFPLPVYTPPQELGYIDADGLAVSRPVTRFDPDVSRTRIDRAEAGAWIRERLTAHLVERGIVHRFRYGKADSWWFETVPFAVELRRLAAGGVTIYLTEDEDRARGGAGWA